MSVTLFANPDLQVRRIDAGDEDPIVVTFDSYHDDRTFDRKSFGEDYFAEIGITAIHVLSRDNEWFQYPEIPQVLSLIRNAVAGARTVMTYGSSMGAYAAIRFADAVGANAVLALSPQYSIDPQMAPFEKRWGHAMRSIRFLPALNGAIRCGCTPVVIYDDRDTDRLHADRIAADTPIIRARAPFGGHPIGAYLSETGFLKSIVNEVLEHRFDAAKLEAGLRRSRRESASYIAGLCESQPPWRPKTTAALARHVLGMAEMRPDMQFRMARRLAALGQFDDALAAHRRADELSPGPVLFLGHSRTLFEAGQPAPALALADRAAELCPTVPDYHDWHSNLREACGDLGGALESMRKAEALDPTCRAYTLRVRQLERRLKRKRHMQLLSRIIGLGERARA